MNGNLKNKSRPTTAEGLTGRGNALEVRFMLIWFNFFPKMRIIIVYK